MNNFYVFERPDNVQEALATSTLLVSILPRDMES